MNGMAAVRASSRHSIIAAVLVLGVVSAAPAQSDDPAASALPAGEGRDLVVQLCAGACHSAEKFTNTRKTAQEWHKTVLEMVEHGAQLFPDDVEAVSKYLSTHFAVEAPAGR